MLMYKFHQLRLVVVILTTYSTTMFNPRFKVMISHGELIDPLRSRLKQSDF